MSHPTDLTQDELLAIAERVDRALNRRHLLPFQSLQYRLGETGRNRVHPFALARALSALARRPTRRSTVAQALQPWIVQPRLYASPELSTTEANHEHQTLRPDLDRLAALPWREGFAELVHTAGRILGHMDPVATPADDDDVPLAGSLRVETSEQTYRLRKPRDRTIYVWVTQRTSWIHPIDRGLWRFLARCARDDAHPLVLARYIDPTTFVLFKFLQVQGLQYYAMWVPDHEYNLAASAAERLGWFHIASPEKKHSHPVFRQLERSVSHLAMAPRENARAMILSVADAGLQQEEPLRRLDLLLTWAHDGNPALPKPWIETLERWEVWLQGGSLTLPRRSSRKQRTSPTHQSPATRPELAPIAGEGQAANSADDASALGFGRKTTITRVPIRLR